MLYPCEYPECDKVFEKFSKLKYHEKVHLGEKLYTCTYLGCDKSYYHLNHLKRHMITHQNNSNELFKCEYEECHASFSTKDHLTRHMKTHLGFLYKCSFEGCDKVFKKHKQRYFHECAHRGELPYKCTVEGCGKQFPTPSKLNHHNFTHLDRNRYLCGEPGCGQSFSKWTEFNSHTKTHHPMKCPVCDKKFDKPSRLKEHIQIHSEDRPKFKCTYEGCNSEFTRSTNLRVHIANYHTCLEKFSCPHCAQTFTTKGSMFKHIKRKHEATADPQSSRLKKNSVINLITRQLDGKLDPSYKYSCPMIGCLQKFKRITSLESHLKRVHQLDGIGIASPPKSSCQTPSNLEVTRNEQEMTLNKLSNVEAFNLIL